MTERQERLIENEREEAAREAAENAAKRTTRNIAKKLLQNGVDVNVVSKSLNLSDRDLNRLVKRLR